MYTDSINQRGESMHIHQQINEQFPMRNTEEQKEAFRNWTMEKIQEYGYTAQVEATDKKQKTKNILVGNPDDAEVIFTAHYDTARRSVVPNMMMPRCVIGSYLYATLMVVPLLVVSIVLGELVAKWTGIEALDRIVYLIVYFGLFYYMMFGGPVNKNNANDNTSGCAALLAIMENMRPEDRNKAAFVFFDNEEIGLVGSRGFAKLHPEIKKNKPIVNLDCVANGDQVLLISKKKAEMGAVYAALKDTMSSNEEYQVHFFGKRGSMMNSDHSQFDLGMGVCACKKAPVVKFACGRIHTPKDTVANTANIDFLAQWMVRMLEKI
ncbi:MAG: M28 family peptidase [Clostridia bacterium]|nr:M28 family peptidase [Clostridia bacterium]